MGEFFSKTDKKFASEVLDYWFAIEFLAQDSYPSFYDTQNRVKKIKEEYRRGNSTKKVIETFLIIKPEMFNQSIESTIINEVKSCGMNLWGNLTFYIGKVKREKCIEGIAKYVDSSLIKKRPEKATDSIAMISLQLSPHGKYIEKSLSISPIIWGLNEIKDNKKELSQIISSSAYNNDIRCIEIEHFDADKTIKITDDDFGESDNSWNDIGARFAIESISWKELKAVYDYFKENYIDGNIETDSEGELQEIYGISFQMFADEMSKNRYEDDNYLGLSHDYYSNDIKLVKKQLKAGMLENDGYMGRDILRYIGILMEDIYSQKRIDLVKPEDKEEFFDQLWDILKITNAPYGKWPSRFMPALMQQVAVNFATNRGTAEIFDVNGKVFSVNGPPGTGKTTLLKEVVVNNIIERAILLAEYNDPDDAFIANKFEGGEKEDNAYSSFTRRWHQLKNDRINDYSILVTSCNNAAVENISKELPRTMLKDLKPLSDDSEELRKMLDDVASFFDIERSEDFIVDRDENKFADIYFTKYAKKLFDREDVWGLIAAPLGKKSNIRRFYRRVLNDLLFELYGTNEVIKSRVKQFSEAKQQFKEQLEIVRSLQEKVNYVNEVYKDFLRYKSDYEKFLTDHQAKKEENQHIVEELEQEEKNLNDEIVKADIYIKEKETERTGLLAQISAGETLVNNLTGEISELKEKDVKILDQVSCFTKIFKPAKYKAVLAQSEDCQARIRDKESARTKEEESLREKNNKVNFVEDEIQQGIAGRDVYKKHKDDIANEVKEYSRKIECLEKEIEDKEREFREYARRYESEKRKATECGDLDCFDLLDMEYINEILSADNATATEAQAKNPWMSQRYNREREKLFALAMKVNKYFVLSSRSCRDNFITLSHYWGVRPGDDNKEIIFKDTDIHNMMPSLIQTLFLLVPVVSSTFASVGILLRHVKTPGTIGLLVVDEAGQAQPQYALGAFYRCRRAMIVGDPKQVEPVVKDDLELLKQAYNAEGLSLYKAKNISVQSFADRMNAIGTYLDNGSDYKEWVGSPLLVHRRCISPMYEISNKLSYGGIMKQKTMAPKKEIEEKFALEKSCWINVIGKENGEGSHFVKEQGAKVCEILELLFSKNSEPSIYIITPFVSVKDGIREYVRSYCRSHKDTKINCDYITGFEQNRIGTVHTFQGKEADEVIFLLGCDNTEGARGAITWVNENIVNVAVTRAKYRLYMIGDADAWDKSQCVSLARSFLV